MDTQSTVSRKGRKSAVWSLTSERAVPWRVGRYVATIVAERFRRLAGTLPHFWKRSLLIAFDVTALSAALWLGFSLRYGIWSPPNSAYQFLVMISGPVIAIPIFIRMGLYRAVIRYLPDRALWTMVQAMSYATLCWIALAFVAQFAVNGYLPRSVPVFYWLFGIVFIAGARFLAKAMLGAAGNMTVGGGTGVRVS